MKRNIFFLLTFSLIVGLCACGQNGSSENTAETLDGSAMTWQEQYDLGVRYLSEGNYQEAIIAFTAVIEIDPKLAPAYVGRGDAYVCSGETEENLAAAQTDYEKALELDETNAAIYLGLANIYSLRGADREALEILQKGLEVINDKSLQDMIDKISSHIDDYTDDQALGDSAEISSDESISTLTQFYATVSNVELRDPTDYPGYNLGSIGQLCFEFVWDTSRIPKELDERIYTALISTWRPDGFDYEYILDEAPEMERLWKSDGSLWKDYPNSNNSFPIFEDDLGTTQQVLLYALDGSGDIIGYLILPVSVPNQVGG